jgi:hydroxymethylbilane synthase
VTERVRIATRQSKLALWQARFVATRLAEVHPGVKIELVGITTRGDRWLSSPLAEIGGKGLFIKELEQALGDGRADLAVHSMKDLPAHLPDEFCLAVVGFREDVRDAFISRSGLLTQLPAGARVGSSSLRRRAQLLARRSDLEVVPVRGNVDTRLAKLDRGEFDALVLALAGLTRLGLAERVTEAFDVDTMVPAAGQGALGIECLRANVRVLQLLEPLVDPHTARLVGAERAVAAALGADCTAPVGAYAKALAVNALELTALVATPDGATVLRASADGSDAQAVAAEVVAKLVASGAGKLLAGR